LGWAVLIAAYFAEVDPTGFIWRDGCSKGDIREQGSEAPLGATNVHKDAGKGTSTGDFVDALKE